jgi:hypothetical protein
MAGNAEKRPVFVQRKYLGDMYTGRRNSTYPVPRVIADPVAGVTHRTVVTGNTHVPGSHHLFLLQGCKGGIPVFNIEGIDPAVVTDTALFRGIRLAGMI